jgi:hypothetical protein
MITNLVVGASMGLALAFVAAWAVSPRLRAWIERPKYHFQDALDDYDRSEEHGRMSS